MTDSKAENLFFSSKKRQEYFVGIIKPPIFAV
jgi:hypothetical protein